MWNDKTPEERRAITDKANATRRANRDRAAALRAEAHQADLPPGLLLERIAYLEAKLAGLERTEAASVVSARLTGKALLTEDEIVDAAVAWSKTCGVYFLVDRGRVVYVGQSVDVPSRINHHRDKQFSSYAFVPCDAAVLDKLESLYIYSLRPPLNGTLPNGSKAAPLSFAELLGVPTGAVGE